MRYPQLLCAILVLAGLAAARGETDQTRPELIPGPGYPQMQIEVDENLDPNDPSVPRTVEIEHWWERVFGVPMTGTVYEYEVDLGDGTILNFDALGHAQRRTIVHEYAEPGTYRIRAKVLRANSTTYSNPPTRTLVGAPAHIDLTLTASVTEGTRPLTVDFELLGIPDDPDFEIRLSTGGRALTFSQESPTATVTFETNGTYDFRPAAAALEGIWTPQTVYLTNFTGAPVTVGGTPSFAAAILSSQPIAELRSTSNEWNARYTGDQSRLLFLSERNGPIRIHVSDVSWTGGAPTFGEPELLPTEDNWSEAAVLAPGMWAFSIDPLDGSLIIVTGGDRVYWSAHDAAAGHWAIPHEISSNVGPSNLSGVYHDHNGRVYLGRLHSQDFAAAIPLPEHPLHWQPNEDAPAHMYDMRPHLMSDDGLIRAWRDHNRVIHIASDGPLPNASLYTYYDEAQARNRYQVDSEFLSGIPGANVEALDATGRWLIAAHSYPRESDHSALMLLELDVTPMEQRDRSVIGLRAPTLLGTWPQAGSPHRTDVNLDGRSDAADLVEP